MFNLSNLNGICKVFWGITGIGGFPIGNPNVDFKTDEPFCFIQKKKKNRPRKDTEKFDFPKRVLFEIHEEQLKSSKLHYGIICGWTEFEGEKYVWRDRIDGRKK